jgi:homopolymeric O-antigen transport system permease protein
MTMKGMAAMNDSPATLKTPLPPPLILRPTRGLAALNLRDLWIFRELIYFMTWRDLKVRYKQTVLGAAWVILQPLMQTLIFTLLFHRAAGFAADNNAPYPIFCFAALLPWNMFAHAMSTASQSLVNNRNMLTKVYFPRMIIPLSPILASLVDFLIAFGVMISLMLYYHFDPAAGYNIHLTVGVFALPLFLLLALITTLGVSLWLAALNVMYRDVGHIIPFLTQIWLFITPIVYSSKAVSAKWQIVYALNPMVGVVNGFRWALIGTKTAPGPMTVVSVFVALLILVSGLFYFRNMERLFADEV